ncbi:ABC transporter permease [Gordonia aichiensis]|uniref:Putative ABC transporter permease protein n=1 Tax=Gordonia aichiensis NBRC 108223 TaxID=1220583 RepID=L7KGN7_9ACTN|nr:ABC transporter permease [Gordonia aichiensis]GAC47789.1 putative ABC transporter permease protein [Gordonia aichiensis NBRC 108223]
MTAAAEQVPARGARPVRVSVSGPTAFAVLTRRSVDATVRTGLLFFAIGSPIVFFTCFYVPLHRRFERSGVDYAQYLLPLVMLQAAMFVAIISCELAGEEAAGGMRDRLSSLPITRLAPGAARMANAVVRMGVSAIAVSLYASIFGFRLRGSVVESLAFFVLAIAFALALSMMADALGSVATHAQSVGQLLMIPQLLLVMCSTGLVPAEAFPGWIEPVVRNQPVSVFAEAMRALSTGGDVQTVPVVGWCIGVVVVGVACLVVAARKGARR